MTPPSPMSREELLELAALDAFGLLDEYEAALFTRSFHHAPVAVQDEIKELQATFVADEALLPDVEPDAGLRAQVLGSVASAIESESVEFAPLAMIGRPRTERRDTVGRLAAGGSATLWRAASFALAAVLLAVLYLGAQNRDRNDQVWDMAIDLLAQEQIKTWILREASEDLLPDLMALNERATCRRLGLHPVNATGGPGKAHAVVLVDDLTGEAFLLAFGLPVGNADAATRTEYTFRATLDEVVEVERTFEPRRSICGVNLGRISTELIASLTWTISNGDEIILRA